MSVFAVLLAVLAAVVGLAPAAHAEHIGWRFYDRYVCVQDQTPTGTNWQRGAYRAGKQLAEETNLFIQSTRGACNNKTKDQRVRIQTDDFGPGFHARVLVSGHDWKRTETGAYAWVPRSPITVQVNEHYGQRTSHEWTRTITHEVLHAVGLDHTDRCDSLMHEDVGRCGYDWRVTAYDAAEVKRLYPAVSLVPARPRR